MRFFAVALIFFGAAASYAQAPEVPHKMQFAGMTLTIRDDARREIQKDVDAFTKSAKYFNIKVERAKTYFPIIERIFAEERLPDDFKYLVIQESALVPDAVSVSDAVGFWQFKDYTAREMGMRVDRVVDERMNIVSASRGAAKYLKQANFYFNNWIYALQSYQMGAGAVQRSIGEEHHGASRMEINSETYWYVKKFLANKIAFENALKGEAQLKVKEYPIQSATTVKDLASQLSVDEKTLRDFNRWIVGNTIPADKNYALILPAGSVPADFDKLTLASSTPAKAVTTATNNQHDDKSVVVARDERKQINGVWAVKPLKGESLTSLAERVKVPISKLARYNDVANNHVLNTNNFYFIEKKKRKAEQTAYTARSGDQWWSISQQFGIELKRLQKYNGNRSTLKAGDVVWLASVKSQGETESVIELQEAEFNWGAAPEPSTGKKSSSAVPEKVSSGSSSNEINENQNEQDQPSGFVHEVKSSDTLFSVARQYNVTIKDLMSWNNKTDFALAVGEKLTVKGK